MSLAKAAFCCRQAMGKGKFTIDKSLEASAPLFGASYSMATVLVSAPPLRTGQHASVPDRRPRRSHPEEPNAEDLPHEDPE